MLQEPLPLVTPGQRSKLLHLQWVGYSTVQTGQAVTYLSRVRSWLALPYKNKSVSPCFFNVAHCCSGLEGQCCVQYTCRSAYPPFADSAVQPSRQIDCPESFSCIFSAKKVLIRPRPMVSCAGIPATAVIPAISE